MYYLFAGNGEMGSDWYEFKGIFLEYADAENYARSLPLKWFAISDGNSKVKKQLL